MYYVFFFKKKGNNVGVLNDHTLFIFHFTQIRQWRAHFSAKYTEMHHYCPCTHDLAPSHGHCGMKIERDMDFIAGENKIPSSMLTRNVKFPRCRMCFWRPINTICFQCTGSGHEGGVHFTRRYYDAYKKDEHMVHLEIWNLLLLSAWCFSVAPHLNCAWQCCRNKLQTWANRWRDLYPW